MSRPLTASNFRATSLVVALLAVTLNFLQPLAHAAALRDGDPQKLWGVFCKPGLQQQDGQPAQAASPHECCLGFVHGPALIAPSSAFLLVEPVTPAPPAFAPADDVLTVAFRDGPTRPRGPPHLV